MAMVMVLGRYGMAWYGMAWDKITEMSIRG